MSVNHILKTLLQLFLFPTRSTLSVRYFLRSSQNSPRDAQLRNRSLESVQNTRWQYPCLKTSIWLGQNSSCTAVSFNSLPSTTYKQLISRTSRQNFTNFIHVPSLALWPKCFLCSNVSAEILDANSASEPSNLGVSNLVGPQGFIFLLWLPKYFLLIYYFLALWYCFIIS